MKFIKNKPYRSIAKYQNKTDCQKQQGNLEGITKIISRLSQAGLLIIAVFGYFYTVIPVYERDSLNEQISKKELELYGLENKLREERMQIVSLNKKTSQLKEDLETQYDELRNRLLTEFEILGSKLCNLDTIEDNYFVECISKSVLSLYNMKLLSSSDKQSIVEKISDSENIIISSWREAKLNNMKLKEEAVRDLEISVSKCRQIEGVDCYIEALKKSVNVEDMEVKIKNSGYNFTRSTLMDITQQLVRE